jgi:putative hydrolase of the HAD superfamily
MTLEAVTFDLWDTLVYNRNYGEFRLPELKRVLKSYGMELSEEALNEAYMSGFRYSSRVIPAENHRHVETEEIVKKVLETVGYTSPETSAELVRIYEEAVLCDPPRLKEGVVDVLSYVKQQYKVGLISVTGVSPGRIIREILYEYGVLQYFDALSFSDEVKFVKPNPRLFASCLEELEVAPENTVHVGDSYKSDVVGAIEAGMRVIWIKTREQDRIQGYVPDAVIRDIAELPVVLKSLG